MDVKKNQQNVKVEFGRDIDWLRDKTKHPDWLYKDTAGVVFLELYGSHTIQNKEDFFHQLHHKYIDSSFKRHMFFKKINLTSSIDEIKACFVTCAELLREESSKTKSAIDKNILSSYKDSQKIYRRVEQDQARLMKLLDRLESPHFMVRTVGITQCRFIAFAHFLKKHVFTVDILLASLGVGLALIAAGGLWAARVAIGHALYISTTCLLSFALFGVAFVSYWFFKIMAVLSLIVGTTIVYGSILILLMYFILLQYLGSKAPSK